MNLATILFLTMFFGIIAILLIIAFYGSRKDKTKRRIEQIQRKEEEDISKVKYTEVYLELNNILDKLEDYLKDFQPSVGIKSMKQINDEISQEIESIVNSDDLREVYLVEERKMELKPILDELRKSKPSKWEIESFFAINVIKAKSNSIKKTTNDSIEEEKIEKEVEDNQPKEKDYSKLTIEQLKQELNDRQIEFKKSSKKNELIELLKENEN